MNKRRRRLKRQRRKARHAAAEVARISAALRDVFRFPTTETIQEMTKLFLTTFAESMQNMVQAMRDFAKGQA